MKIYLADGMGEPQLKMSNVNDHYHKYIEKGETYISEGKNIYGKKVKAVMSKTECECGEENIKFIRKHE